MQVWVCVYHLPGHQDALGEEFRASEESLAPFHSCGCYMCNLPKHCWRWIIKAFLSLQKLFRGTWQRAVDLASKFPKCQSDWTSVGRAEKTSLIHGGPARDLQDFYPFLPHAVIVHHEVGAGAAKAGIGAWADPDRLTPAMPWSIAAAASK